MKNTLSLLASAIVLVAAPIGAQRPQADEHDRLGANEIATAAELDITPSAAHWRIVESVDWTSLTVLGPEGFQWSRRFSTSEDPSFVLSSELGELADGQYEAELRVQPPLSRQQRQELDRLLELGDERTFERLAARLPQQRVQSDLFLVRSGLLEEIPAVAFGNIEPGRERVGDPADASSDLETVTSADQVISDDLIVLGKACFGSTCTNNMSFGGSHFRLRGPNLLFESTLPQIVDSWEIRTEAYGMGFRNATTSGSPLWIRTGAPAYSLVLSPNGNVGMGTTTPLRSLHIVDTVQPSIRIDDSVNWWDWRLAGGDFYLQHSSKVPFFVDTLAPNFALAIRDNGIGLGTLTPTFSLDIERDDGSAGLRVRELSSTTANRVQLQLQNNGTSIIRTVNSAGVNWDMAFRNSWYALRPNTGGDQMRVYASGRFTAGELGGGAFNLDLSAAGDLNVTGDGNFGGVVNQSSSRTVKKNLEAVDAAAVLDLVDALELVEWSYVRDDDSVRHLGPIAEDFAAVFGLGRDNRHIATGDVAGVALAAIQALHQENEELRRQLERSNELLRQQLEELSSELAVLRSGGQ